MEFFKNSGEYKHFKGGEYKLICNVIMQGESMVLYQSLKSNSYWLRFQDDFFAALKNEQGEYQRFAKVRNFTAEESLTAYNEFINRMNKGEKIVFENDMKLCKLAEDYTMQNPQIIKTEEVFS